MPESPPIAPPRPTVLRHGDDERTDPYFWLRDRDDPRVLAHLEAENAYTEAALAHHEPLRKAIYSEIVGRVQETDASAPSRLGPYEYFTRTVEGRQYAIHCRRPAATPGLPDPFATPGTDAGEEVILDENALAQGNGYFAVGDLAMSPDHALLAFSTDVTGAERYLLRIRGLDGRDVLADRIENVYYGVAWASDNRTIFYIRPDDAMRPWQVWRHAIGTAGQDDVLVFEEPDEHFYVSVGRTRSDDYVVITSASKTTTEVRLVPAATPEHDPRVVEPRTQDHEYHVDHHRGSTDDRLFVLTNTDGAFNFKVMVAPTERCGRSDWSEFLPHRADVRVEDIDAHAGHLVVSERADGLERLRVMTLGDDGTVTSDRVLALPDEVYSVWSGSNPEFDTTSVRYGYTSLATPVSSFDYDVTTGTSSLVKRQPVIGFDQNAYEVRRLWADAPDGVRVPVSLVARRDTLGHGPVPLLLYGYGSYEVSIDPAFSSSRISLLDRGVAFAIAHVRGGGELGRRWYEDGKLLQKRNTFTDFLACAEHLVAEGFTTPDLLAARGGSAGGLLMGAVANLRPDLFRAIVAEVPFVDCLTTILDESLPLTVTEWEEWGDPVHDPAVYDYMKSYSPYDNVAALDYPALLVTGGLNDPRVQYWEPAKWVAKLRAMRTDSRQLVLKMEMGAGHSGPSGRYDAWQDEAFVLAFVLDQLAVD
jgi:oligopeptidase B